MLGPSGCGKTTLLRLIAGFERVDAGRITVGGRVVSDPSTHLAAERRGVGFVPQEGALFPHLDVRSNIAFGLPRKERGGPRVAELIDLLDLGGLEQRLPHELSGGQQQRVALARALAPTPELILLDEPFSSLDAGLRDRLRQEVRDILARAGVTTLFVTHDQAEALSIAETVAVMRDGIVEQAGTPEAIYSRPSSRWVADFLGEVEVVPGEAAAGRVQLRARLVLGRAATSTARWTCWSDPSRSRSASPGRRAPRAPRSSAATSSATTSSWSSAWALGARSAPAASASRPGTRATASGRGSTGPRTCCRAADAAPP